MRVTSSHPFHGRSACHLPHLDHTCGYPGSHLLPPPPSSPCLSKHLCRCGSVPAVTDGYRMRPSVLRCVQLYFSGVPICYSEHPVCNGTNAFWWCPLPCALFIGTPAWIMILILPSWLDWELQVQDMGSFRTSYTGIIVICLNRSLYFLMASLCLF